MASPIVCAGATLMCTGGTMPATLSVTPEKRVTIDNKPAANIMDHVSAKNIPTFGMCIMQSNPAVAAATAAALGVPTPAPCVPNTVTPWVPGSPTVMVGGQPALTQTCTCNCAWGGVISIPSAGQIKTTAA